MNIEKEQEAIARLQEFAPSDGEAVMKWWLGENTAQLTFFSEDEVSQMLYEMGVQ